MDIQVSEAGWKNEAFGDATQGKMLVFFHKVQVKHDFRSKKEKRPIFVEKIFIKKLVPGDSRLEIDRPMRDTDMEEFPIEWARFEQKKANLIVGTPIEAWPAINDTQKAEFRALNIFTIDQFANLADSVGDKIMGFLDLRKKARAFINAAKSSEDRSETDAKLAAHKAEIEELKAQIASLAEGKGKKVRKQRVYTEEQKQAARERMEKYHAERAAKEQKVAEPA